MAKILWIDASAGASGDMLLGALVDLGVPLGVLRKTLSGLPIDGWSVTRRKAVRAGLAATRVVVRVPGDADVPGPFHETRRGHGRTWRTIRRIVSKGGLPPAVRDRALAVFERLFEAEARAHGLPVDTIHLHEAGALDAIVDVVGVCAGIERLGARRIVVSPLTTGRGTVACSHGIYPVPGPATTHLLAGVPLSGIEAEGERLTPTGAALLTTLADAWGGIPAMVPERTGCGAGTRDFPERPNCVRLVLGTESGAPAPETLVVECTIDDGTPQAIAFAVERLFEAGALEVFQIPVAMKKGRLGHLITAIARPEAFDAVTDCLLRETTTIGLRFRREGRIELDRRIVAVATRFGRIRVKEASRGEVGYHAWPEFDDCAAAARRAEVPLLEVQRAALEAHRRTRKGSR